MTVSVIIVISIAVIVALLFLAAETIREFRKMDRKPDDFTGSDRLAGSAE